MKHTCHVPSCKKACPPAHLMCRKCWSMVEPDTQREVYATVRQRNRSCDASWAPWWRAQATAVDEVLRQLHPNEDERREKLLAREMKFADSLEK